MPSDRRERSASAGSNRSGHSRAGSSMGYDVGDTGRRMAVEDDYIRNELQDSNAFCNSFWGINDAGYPVVQARMKGAIRVLDEMKVMYKERADIEAEYSKRLAKLAKQTFGKDETGSMRAAIEVVRAEIDQTSKTHSDLSTLIKKDLEGQIAEFSARLLNQRKNSQAQIEKLFKQKQTQENYVNKSKDKYEQDCIKINGYTAQSSLVQGRDLDKVTNKLDKAQSTVSSNDKDYQNFVRALKDTTYRWNSEWKAYLDQCQDLEEDRLEYLKGNLWNYANAISAVCVADDESCERVRVSLETCEAPKDIVDFIQRSGTGSAIADPPEYINYSKGQPPPPRPTFKTANFQRSTARQVPFIPNAPSMPVNTNAESTQAHLNDVDVSAINLQVRPRQESLGAASTQISARGNTAETENGAPFRPPPGAVGMPGMVSSGMQGPILSELRREETQSPPQMDHPKPQRRMSARNFMARTPSMNKSRSQQGGDGGAVATSAGLMAPSETTSTVSTQSTQQTTIDHDDPIAKALANLRMRPGGRSPAPQSPAGSVQQQTRPYSKQGGPFDNEPRAKSPGAAFMQQPERATSPLPVEQVLDQYGQSFPGERRLSRQNSAASRTSRMSVQQVTQSVDRSKSPGPSGQGFAGVGARGRSPSPQPFHHNQYNAQGSQLPSSQYGNQSSASILASPSKQAYNVSSQSRPAQANISGGISGPARSTTPLGIALDASGSVTHDQMADDYHRRGGSVGPGQIGSMSSQPAVQRLQTQLGNSTGRTISPVPTSSVAVTPGHSFAPPLHQQNSYQYQQHTQQQQQQQIQQQAPPPVNGQQYGYQQLNQSGYNTSPLPISSVRQPSQAQDSLGRQSIYGGYTGGPSSYNQTPSSGMHAHPSQQGGTVAPSMHNYNSTPVAQQQGPPPPNGSQYNQAVNSFQAPTPLQDSAAAAYMHQYRQQHSGTPSSAPAQQSSYHQPMQQQQQQQQPNRWSTQGVNYSQSQYQAPPPQQQAPAPIQQAPGPARNSTQSAAAAAPPTGQFSDTGKPILFYVKALYDYQATTEEEFSFTAGDIMAVWETNPDGWWQGELLDDARRRVGANTFPSNFVSLLT